MKRAIRTRDCALCATLSTKPGFRIYRVRKPLRMTPSGERWCEDCWERLRVSIGDDPKYNVAAFADLPRR